MRGFTTKVLLVGAGMAVAAAVPVSLAREEPQALAVTARGAAAVAYLRSTLDQVVERPGWEGDEWSILAVSLDRGDTIFARTPERALAPASNMKLFTSVAALHYLGADHRFATYMLTDGRIENGVLVGNVHLYGTGDPTLGTRFAEMPAPPLVAFADTLVALGVREIRGDIIGDGSYFSGPGTGEGWEADYMNDWYASPAGALSVHENLVRIEIGAADSTGERMKFIPGGRGIAVQEQPGTGGVVVRRDAYDGPIVIRGAIGAATSSHAVPVSDPAMYAAALFRDVLAQKQVVHAGNVRAVLNGDESAVTDRRVFAPALDGGSAPLRVLAVHVSEPMREILRVINHESHNFYSEMVLRAVGRAAGGDGSAAAGARAVEQLLAGAGVDTAQVRVVDGCGLSPLNRVNAGAFVALLAHVAQTPNGRVLQEALPVAGEVRRFMRMGGTAAAGNLRAKTGTIDHVSSLSGYVTAANGERLAFSIISNNVPSVGQAKYIENVIGAELAAFDRARASAAPAVAAAGD